MKRWLLILVTAGFVLLGGWLFYHEAWIASRGGVASPLYSTQRYDPYGVAALYQLLQRQGHAVDKLQRPDLPRHAVGVLLQILPASDDAYPSQVATPHPQTQPQEPFHPEPDPSEPGQDADHEKKFQTPRKDSPSSVTFGRGHDDPYDLSAEEVLEWVSQGNTLLQMSRSRTRIMDMAGLPPPTVATHETLGLSIEMLQAQGVDPEELPEAEEAQWTAEARQEYHLAGPGPLLRQPLSFSDQGGRPGWKPLAVMGNRVVAGQIPYGRGLIIVIGAPTPALNHMLGQAGNLPLMLSLVGSRPVLFDAWSNHPRQLGTLMELIRQFGLLPMLLQLVLLLLVYQWSTRGQRRQLPLEVDRPRSSVEQILTLGYLYEQAMDERVAAIRIAAEVRHRVAKGLSCSPGRIEHRLVQPDLNPARAEQARTLLAAAQALTSRWPGSCNQCGYDLQASVTPHCPVCGQASSSPSLPAIPGVVSSSAAAGAVAKNSTDRHGVMGELSRLLTLSHDFATGNRS